MSNQQHDLEHLSQKISDLNLRLDQNEVIPDSPSIHSPTYSSIERDRPHLDSETPHLDRIAENRPPLGSDVTIRQLQHLVERLELLIERILAQPDSLERQNIDLLHPGRRSPSRGGRRSSRRSNNRRARTSPGNGPSLDPTHALGPEYQTEPLRISKPALASIRPVVVRLPDPPKLSDGKDPTFETWLLEMEGKLRLGGFPDEESKMLYLFSRTRGIAREQLLTRLPNRAQP
ncbi:uncharacterized protein LY89DRAFT_765614 [Mollisia scopiformis]|uniref:Uncharacterized protein n=1 Tax=Mollisia scopiformis TaxID=149040 RepID=A0A132B6V5_MOLSC|nr:uncharacterized protein LY89DRAFT_765614 [Mollisia scopiformis]KUJ08142.1 hypothetical protein LY89DRAFT_765614 [Mollisia scopiformis]